MILTISFAIALIIAVGFIIFIYFMPTEKKDAHFERINDVEGVLHSENESIRTYNVGSTFIGDNLEVYFYNNSTSLLITDVIYQNKSLFMMDNPNKTYREKADWALAFAKKNANAGRILISDALELENVILRVDDINRYLEERKIRILPNDDYEWI